MLSLIGIILLLVFCVFIGGIAAILMIIVLATEFSNETDDNYFEEESLRKLIKFSNQLAKKLKLKN